MNTRDFLKILKEPTQLKNEQVFEFEDIIRSFPYFQAARVLHLKGLKDQNSFRYNNSLKTTAIHTTNRSVLFHFITSDTFNNTLSKKQETEIIDTIDSIDRNVVENINNENLATEQEHSNKPDFEASSQKIEYIAETNLESLQKEVALSTHDEEIRLQQEKEQIKDVDYSEDPTPGGLSFEIDPKESIHQVDSKEVYHANDNPNSDKTNIRFELIQEELIKPESETSQLEKNAIVIDLDAEKPIQFNRNDTYSFNDWLQLSSFKPIDRSSSKRTSRNINKALIDEFIEKNPKIKPSKLAGFSVHLNQEEEIESDVVMTETLARVYTEQKKYNSAIEAYEILSLKFPEKSGFFADRIKMLKKLKQE